MRKQILKTREMVLIKEVTLKDSLKSVSIRRRVNAIKEKLSEIRHIPRMPVSNKVKQIKMMGVQGKRPRKREKGQLMDCLCLERYCRSLDHSKRCQGQAL